MSMDYYTVPSDGVGVAPVTTSAVSAQSATLKAGDYVCVCSALTFVVRGENPTATLQGLPVPPNFPAILRGVQEGEKLAFVNIAAGSGVAYICRQS